MKNGMVFNFGGDAMGNTKVFHRISNGHVIGLGAARSENYFSGSTPQQLGYFLARQLNLHLHFSSMLVGAGRISKMIAKHGRHYLKNLGIEGRSSGIIEINTH
jgi:hypothetical protein